MANFQYYYSDNRYLYTDILKIDEYVIILASDFIMTLSIMDVR